MRTHDTRILSGNLIVKALPV